MSKIIATVFYCITILLIIAELTLDVIGKKNLSTLNFTLLIVFGIFTTMVFGEIVLKDLNSDNKRIQ
jgi:uncharacterized membrane protein YcaP (DUF421 family)